jgi:hypothetical protein
MRRDIRYRWIGSLATLALLTALVPDLAGSRADFRPFEMTIEIWSAEAGSRPDGTKVSRTEVYRVEYHDRRNWKMTRIEDPARPDLVVEGRVCINGRWHHYQPGTGWVFLSDDPSYCNGIGRWIHWGLAWSYPWVRTPGPEPHQVTLTDPGERIVFDLRTGLPVVYEAGRIDGEVGYRETYRLERHLDE